VIWRAHGSPWFPLGKHPKITSAGDTIMLRSLLPAFTLLAAAACESLQAGGDRALHDAEYGQPQDTSVAPVRRLQADDVTDYNAAPLPGGREFVVTDWWGTGDLGVRNLATGELRRLTRNVAPYEPGHAQNQRVSRDGAKVAFTFDPADGKGRQLQIVELDGSEPRTLVAAEPGEWIQAEDWSRDGRMILGLRQFADQNHQIILIDVADGAIRPIRMLDQRASRRMNFSHDDRYIVYDFPARSDSNEDRDIYTLELASGREVRLIEHPANDFVLGWGPDADHVLFASDRSGTPGAWLVRVAEGRAVGAPALVRPDLWGVHPGAFGSEGSYYYTVDAGTYGIYTASIDPQTGRLIGSVNPISRENESFPRWSPDGNVIATRAQSTGSSVGGRQWSFRFRSLETGGVREFPLPIGLQVGPHVWAPDGSALFFSATEGPRRNLYRIDLLSGNVETVVTFPEGVSLRRWWVEPNGRALVYRTQDRRRVPAEDAEFHRDLITRTEQTICRGPATSATVPYLYPAMEPGGDRMARMEERGDRRALTLVGVVDDSCELKELATVTTIPDNRTPQLPGVAWSRDARSIFYLTRNPEIVTQNVHEIWRVTLDGGAPARVGIEMPQLMHQDIDPSGRRIVFAAGEWKDELWVMEDIIPGRSAERGRW
jgi:Tol biopolymer transport system component